MLCNAWDLLVTLTFLEANAAEFTYDQASHSKEPDESWIPRDIDANNPNVRLQPGTSRIYPTFVLEVGYQHESYPELLSLTALSSLQ